MAHRKPVCEEMLLYLLETYPNYRRMGYDELKEDGGVKVIASACDMGIDDVIIKMCELRDGKNGKAV